MKTSNIESLEERINEPQLEHDSVHSPSHYIIPGTGTEVIDVIQGILSPEQFRGYCYGNVIKYILRAPNKGGAEDLEKAKVYLDWLTLDLDERTLFETENQEESSEEYRRGYEDGYDKGCMDMLDDGTLIRRDVLSPDGEKQKE